MKALVTGATGFLGRHLMQRLLQEGEEVWALARTSQPAAFLQGPGVRVVEGDVRRWLSLRQAVQGAESSSTVPAKLNRRGAGSIFWR